MFLSVVFLVSCGLCLVNGHGMLMDPVSRNSAWRKGFNTPPNYTDNEQFCGSSPTYWPQDNGKCGTCGDPYNAKQRKYEHPSKHATGTIVKTYNQGDVITATVRITANHMGAFEFRIADIGTPPITQEKLNKNLLQLADGSGTRWKLPRGAGEFQIKLRLPKDLSCAHCVLQWWWKVGNSWGCDASGCGNGKGRQETFVNCADVTIVPSGGPSPTAPVTQPPTPEPPQPTNPPQTQPPVTQPPTPEPPKPTDPPQTQPPVTQPPTPEPPKPTDPPQTQPPVTQPPPSQAPGGCRAAGPWTGNANMDVWCKLNCQYGYCPPTHCTCD